MPKLDMIHSNMLTEYSDTTIRKSKSYKLTIVEKAENYIEMNFSEDISMEVANFHLITWLHRF